MGSPPLLGSPLSPLSPRLSIPSSKISLRNRLPTQIRRCLPLYLTCLCVVLLILNADLVGISMPRHHRLNIRREAYKDYLNSKSGRHSATAPKTPARFPRKVWQTWKVDPLSFAERDSLTARTWTARNPDYRYEVLTDDNDMAYVEYHFGPDGFDRPDIVDFYRNVNATIIKADLLRYIIMYAEGGVYADIDVEALKPAHRFVPERYAEEDVDLVIGVEIDQPQYKDHSILGSKCMSFCQWTFMAKPRLPVMLHLIENIMGWLDGVAVEQGVAIPEVQLDFDKVISGTGPSAFTQAVLEDMNMRRKLDESNGVSSGGKRGPYTWEDFHDLDESKVVSRILVLDVEAFAAGQGHSDSGNHNARGALVKHHYHASNWPSRHPRFSHPAYGEVERCNWDPMCVAKWDQDVAEFKKLPAEQQQQLIAARQL
ncbi:initiation-specific alpha-1,6-mannosyltransferase [Gaeumannomyces tritici R3-111a-1]|uniref:Initiation-specific alpha-1,6-mannosyltransferase n=1 Tax=Gaeumannomyces tritici (strain R3-111a-1) TaxID=644352 RepID=J3NUY3_GAET3|nr:initiation-specific alpha-1,6-mannosyltransferase [Gaeumannomyces tritici R3-111a-1]EJT75155.1 initiation-specific alpha-1,6-mannosyltransferase [Gaeumannomyces tritici R3-111a-1]